MNPSARTRAKENPNPSQSAKETRSERIASILFRRINSGFYPEGRLPSQRELAESFGVSRNSIVSALEKLEADGWIEMHDKRRAVLTPPDHAFSRKLSSFLDASRFRPPLMNDAFGRKDLASEIGAEAVDLSVLCNEHWDDHINFDIEHNAVEAAMQALKSGRTDIYRTTGVEKLKDLVCSHLTRFGVEARTNEMLIIPRRLQAYRLVAEVLLGNGAELWMPELSLPRFYGVGERHTTRRRFLEMDAAGTIDFEPALFSKRPKLLLLEPTHQKPTGATIAADDRRRVVEAARRANTFIFEDAYCELLEEEHLPSFASFDPKKEAVIHLGAIPTWLSPVGCFSFILANERIIELLRASVRRDYLTPELLTQLAAAHLLASGSIYEMLSRFHAFHRERRTFADRVLEERIGSAAHWNLHGSFGCIWVELPGIDIPTLYEARRDVDFQPGWFYGEPTKACRHVLFRYTLPAADFKEGVSRFERLLRADAA